MITIQKDILVIINPKNPQDDVEISLDETIYPQAYDLIMAIKEMDFEKPEKAVYDVVRLRKILWHLGVFLQGKLNLMSTRDPDYATVEYEFKDMQKASTYVVGIVELLGTGYNVFENSIANPHSRAALNGLLVYSGVVPEFFCAKNSLAKYKNPISIAHMDIWCYIIYREPGLLYLLK